MILTSPLTYAAGKAVSQGKLVKQSKNYNVFSPTVYSDDERNKISQSNPYANVDYRQSWMQSLLEKLGFRTNKDAYLESMALQSKEFDSQVAQKFYNEDYDSALSQAQREREAGLNPNLTGNVSSGDSSPMVDDGNPPISPEADDLSIVQNFASGVLNAVQVAFGLYGDIQSMRGVMLNNDSNEMNLVKSAWSMIIPDLYENRNDLQDGRIDVNNYWNSLHKQFGHSMSKKRFSRFVNRVNQFANSAEGWKMVYDTQTQKAKARKSMFRELAPDSYSEWDDVMSLIGDELGNLAFQVEKTGLENSKEYNENFAPDVAAKLASNPDDLAIKSDERAIKHNERLMSDYQVSLRSSFKSILNKLDDLSYNGNHIAPILKAVLSAWLMGMFK